MKKSMDIIIRPDIVIKIEVESNTGRVKISSSNNTLIDPLWLARLMCSIATSNLDIVLQHKSLIIKPSTVETPDPTKIKVATLGPLLSTTNPATDVSDLDSSLRD